jgi:hypothetical protein
MAQIDPRMLLQAAMAQGENPAAPGVDPQLAGGVPGSAPGQAPGLATQAQPAGQPNVGGLSATDLASQAGVGADLQQDPDAMQSAVAMLQDPATPPDQKLHIQRMLQLAALQSIAGGPQGATGSSS